MSLLNRHVGFVAALREAGLKVSVAEDIDAAQAIGVVGMLDRERLRDAYAATVVKRHTHRAAFDTVFDLFFPATTDGGTSSMPQPTSEFHRDDPELARLRGELSTALLAGDDDTLARLARDGVARFGAVPGRTPGTRSWSSYAAHTRISPQTLLAGLLQQAVQGQDTGGLAERVARTALTARIDRFRRMLDTEVQRRLAEQSSAEQVARTAVKPSLENIELQSATRADLAAIRREIEPLARRLAARLAIVQRRGRRGHLDVRRTIRASLSTGGIPMETRHRPRRPHKTDLVIMCDVSESVTSFARFTLMLVYALREQFSRMRVFAFIDDLDEVTDFFRPGIDVLDAVGRVAAEAKVHGWYGRTDYGRVFGLFNERHLDAITSRTALLVLGDARSNYGDPGLRALEAMAGRARRAHWLNPERRTAWDTGDSVAEDVARIVPMVECRNLAQLSAFVRELV
jgi:uncharacterized protein